MRQGTLEPMAREHQPPEEECAGLEPLVAAQSPAPLTLHISWGGSPDWRVKGKIQERVGSLLGVTEQ